MAYSNPEHLSAFRRKYRKTPRGRYQKQKEMAAKAGIRFLLSFEQWWDIWQKSGKWKQRGTCSKCFVMSRIHAVGPYAKNNVRIVTARQKSLSTRYARGENHHNAILSKTDVLAIREELSRGRSPADIAKSRGLKRTHIHDIKGRRTWAYI